MDAYETISLGPGSVFGEENVFFDQASYYDIKAG
jgi:hypothetical protein